MASDFFQRQSEARRNTSWLVLLFLVAVVGIVAIVFVAAAMATQAIGDAQSPRQFDAPPADRWGLPAAAAGGALALIAGGSLFKVAQLSGGGTTVAERLGGRRIYPNATDPTEQRILNVVEEMSIASGVPVPPVFLLTDERSINAFAAGYSPSDAVIGVTRGCAELLSRDELQGVMAHEFSHILNGDMRLNVRLIGILHGILLLGLVGRALVRSTHFRSRNSKDNSAAYVLAIGVALVVVGLIGTLMGNIIKAAVSRQREYLADASAVQFTRNPGGLSGALKKIGALVFGSRLEHPNAAEASHLYFARGLGAALTALTATHPPLEARIRRLDPQWNGKFAPLPSDATRSTAASEEPLAGLAAASMPAAERPQAASATSPVPVALVAQASHSVGEPCETHRAYAAQLVSSLPAEVISSVHEPYGARAVVFCLLLDRDADVRKIQLKRLSRFARPDVVELTERLAPIVDTVDTRARLPLIDMALPALRAMSPRQYDEFKLCFRELVEADQRIGLFEWSLFRILLRHLEPQFRPARVPRVLYYGLQRLGDSVSVLLSTLAHVGHSEDGAERALEAAAHHVDEVDVQLLPREACGLKALDDALTELTKVAAKKRQRLIDACAASICADQEVQVREVELLRAISDMLDCPMPPLLAGQPVAASAATAAPRNSDPLPK